MYNGRNIEFFTIGNENIEAVISNLGAAIEQLRVKMPDGSWRDICLRYRWPTDRMAGTTYSGAVIGRVANRIAGGSFTLGGRTYALTKNDGNNTLHGGTEGFDRRFFDVAEGDGRLALTITSKDGDQGFPGELNLRVEYSLQGASLTVRFFAKSSADTVWAPTLHPYFRLGDEDTVDRTYLQIYADAYTPMNGQIPTGEIRPVDGTPFDFRTPKEIGRDIADAALAETNGYDHNFVLNGSHAATAYNKSSGVTLDVYTDMPGLHFYSGNFLSGFTGTHDLRPREGFALEPQFFPNAVNTPAFARPLLPKGVILSHFIRYEFAAAAKNPR